MFVQVSADTYEKEISGEKNSGIHYINIKTSLKTLADTASENLMVVKQIVCKSLKKIKRACFLVCVVLYLKGN